MAATRFPHRYQVTATARPAGDVLIVGDRLRAMRTQAPEAFGGPGDRWSPEMLLVGAVADCFALTFRATAASARLPWESLECEADGTLDRRDGVTRFTAFRLRAYLTVPQGTSEEEAARLLARTKENCLVTNSLVAPCAFEGHVEVAGAADEAAAGAGSVAGAA